MTLYIVGTPIGNLEDITKRAERILSEADFVIAEDPLHSLRLLDNLGLKKSVLKYHQQSSPREIEAVMKRLVAGENGALVTDAGTPGVADPGGVLVEAARLAGVAVVPIPGVSAVTTLLSVAGIPTDSYLFIGFLPKKKGRMTLMQQLSDLDVPIVVFESPMRMAKTCQELAAALGEDRRVIIGRELTKMHEEVIDTTLAEAAVAYAKAQPKGEFVMVVDRPQ